MTQISQVQVKWAYVHMDIYVDARLIKFVVKFTKASSDVRKKKLTNANALVILCSRFIFIGDPTIDTMFVSNRISGHQTGAGAITSVVQLLRKRTITP